MSDEGWEPFRNFDDAGSAQIMCTWLLREQLPPTDEELEFLATGKLHRDPGEE